jgi:hypothetical protein
MILPIEMKEGRGGIAVSDIGAILPDVLAPKGNWCVIYTGLFPTGLSVKGDSVSLCAEWSDLLQEMEAEYEEEECEEEEAEV